MPRRKQDQPVITTVSERKTTVTLGTYSATIRKVSEPERRCRFRVEWWYQGKRVTFTTGDWSAAVQRACEVVVQRCEGRSAVAGVSAATLERYIQCERALPVPLEVAVRHYLDTCSSHFTPKLVSEVVEEYIAAKESRRGKRKASVRWIQTIRGRLRPFAQAFPKCIHEITKEEIGDYLDNPAWAERTQFNMQQSIGILFRAAQEAKALPGGNTAFDAHMRSPRKAEKPVELEKELLAPGDLRRLLGTASRECPVFVSYLAICAFAPVRSEEANRLEWGKHVDLQENIIRCTPDITKTSRRRLIRIHPTLREWLSLAQAREGVVQPLSNAHKIKSALVKKAGISRWPHNALRVSVISYGMALDANAAALADSAGHSEVMLQTIYKQVHGATASRAREWFESTPAIVLQS